MLRKGVVPAVVAVLVGVVVAEAADIAVEDLSLAPGETGTLVVSAAIADEETWGITILVEILPRAGNTGTLEFTLAPPTDIALLGDVWEGNPFPELRFSTFDTDLGSPSLNATGLDNGTLQPALVTWSGQHAGFPVVASADASGVWDVTLSTSVGASLWELPATSNLTDGTVTVSAFSCSGPGNGDVSGDGLIDGGDVGPFTDVLLNNPTGTPVTPEFCASDMDESGIIDMTDLDMLVAELLGSSPRGACCFSDGGCQEGLTEAECGAAGGEQFRGVGSECASVTCPVRPLNDGCGSAEVISGAGTFSFDNTEATTDGVFHTSCGSSSAQADVWFCWTADCDGGVWVETCGQTTVETSMAVYDGCGTCPPTSAELLACDDNACDGQSRLLFTAVNGQSYLIRLGASGEALGGSGTFTVTCTGHAPGADECANAEAISGEATFAFDNSTATMDGLLDALCESHGTPDIDHDVWYCWTSPCDGTVTVETCDLTIVDTKIAVYDGCGCPMGGGILACSDDDCVLQTSAQFSAVTGQTYLIRVGTYPDSSGDGGVGSISITCGPP